LTLLRLFGIPVTNPDARHLISTLMAEGGVHALSAAAMIEKGLDRGLYTVALETEQRDAILAVLELRKQPEGLAGLHGVLARDHADRNYWN
jgi:hypothetical protein